MKSFELRKDWSDWVKLIAAILVAVSHYSTVVVINNHWSDSSFLRLWCQGGYIGVALFFFFSGYGLMESDAKKHLSVSGFFRKRFLKVYLPVLMVSVIWIPVYYKYIGSIDFNMWTFLYDVFWDFRDCVLWFVKILFLLYGFFCIFTYLLHRKKTVMSHTLIAFGTITATWLAYYNGYPFISVPLFLLGVWSSNVKEKGLYGVPLPFLLISAMALIYGIFFLLYKSADALHGVVNCIILLLILGGCVMAKRFTPPITFKLLSICYIYIVYCTF